MVIEVFSKIKVGTVVKLRYNEFLPAIPIGTKGVVTRSLYQDKNKEKFNYRIHKVKFDNDQGSYHFVSEDFLDILFGLNTDEWLEQAKEEFTRWNTVLINKKRDVCTPYTIKSGITSILNSLSTICENLPRPYSDDWKKRIQNIHYDCTLFTYSHPCNQIIMESINDNLINLMKEMHAFLWK